MSAGEEHGPRQLRRPSGHGVPSGARDERGRASNEPKPRWGDASGAAAHAPSDSANAVKQLCRQYQLIPSKGMGQNFLVEPRVAEQLVDALRLTPREVLVEIGAGFGALTARLIERGVTVIAVERDRRLGRALRDRFGDRPDLRLIVDDFLRVDWSSFGGGPFVIAGNLPYVITSPVLDRLVRHRAQVTRAVLTVQRELADRMAAAPGSKTFGALTCFVQCFFVPTVVAEISPKAFWPQPAVTSAILSLAPRTPPYATEAELEPMTAVVQALFQRRRKTLLNGLLHPALSLTREQAQAIIQEIGLDPVARPETLAVPSFVQLGRAWQRIARATSPTERPVT